jgi:hypothetical protein
MGRIQTEHGRHLPQSKDRHMAVSRAARGAEDVAKAGFAPPWDKILGWNQIGQGLGGMFGGMFGGDSGKAYKKAWEAAQPYFQQGVGAQQPYAEAGQRGLGGLEEWLKGMQDPSGFINQLMGGYQESPWAKFQKQEGQSAINNAASASGLLGSTPYMQEGERYAQGIGSQDMQQWLANVLGIHGQYGSGQAGLAGMGQGAANQLSNLYGMMGQGAGQSAFGQERARQMDRGGLFGGLGNLVGGLGNLGAFAGMF